MAWAPELFHLKCEENAANTTVVDSSANALTAVASANTSLLTDTGKIGNGFNAAGSRYFKVNDANVLDIANGVMSICFWLKQTTGGTIFSKGTTSGVGKKFEAISASGTNIQFRAYNNAVGEWSVTSPNLNTSELVHVVITLDGTGDRDGVKIYYNAVLQSVSVGGSDVVIQDFTNTEDFIFGARPGGVNINTGLYDDCRFFAATLTDAQITAIYNGGTGTQSALADLEPATAPGQVTGLSATAISSSQINLSWTAPADDGGSAITGYKIERESPTGGGFSTLVADTGTTDTTYSNTSLTASTQYNYRVSAINAVGTGTASSEASDTTDAASSGRTDIFDPPLPLPMES